VNTISCRTHTLLQSTNHATDHVDGVAVDDNREVRFDDEHDMSVDDGL
jgi:hypothetical protein